MFGDPSSRSQRFSLGALRIVAGFLWMPHGAQKLFGVLRESGSAAEFLSLAWFAGVIELFGGLAITLGFLTRAVAFVAAGEMAAAYFLSHAPRGFWPILNRGELAALYCVLWLYLVVNGGGAFSLDGLLARRRKR
ncbi:MAG: DoxX family protein [Candidatus Rokubacteria bacterium]|nr:DoxX family protein [Candidatus Rokubacteria bacterium]MBI2878163.1 DoxX family protein [Candidatus Rokubacteria bacterium]